MVTGKALHGWSWEVPPNLNSGSRKRTEAAGNPGGGRVEVVPRGQLAPAPALAQPAFFWGFHGFPDYCNQDWIPTALSTSHAFSPGACQGPRTLLVKHK